MDIFADQQDIHDQLRLIVECTPGAVYWKDIKGRYLGCNKYMVETSGFDSSDDLVGKTDYDFFSKDEADRLLVNDQQVIQSKSPLKTEEIINFHGEELTFAVVKIPLINSNGEVVGIVGNSVDITDGKKLAATSNLIKGVQILTDSLAHELRTPLSNIATSIKNIEKTCEKLVSIYEIAKNSNLEEMPLITNKEIKFFETSTRQITEATKQSLEYIDLVNNSVNLQTLDPQLFTKIDVIDITKDAINEFLYNKPEKSKELINLKNSGTFQFVGDTLFFKRIIANLLDNAFYFINKSGKGEIYINALDEGNFDILEFTDTSAGVASTDLAHIFDHFFSKKENGTGIGLALCRYVMQCFNGDILCESVEGEYTKFKLLFPKNGITVQKDKL